MKTRTLSFALFLSVSLFVLPALASASTQQDSCKTNTALFDIPGDHIFTVPSGVTELRVITVGGGGGGGSGSGAWGSGGGGGCGGGIAGGTMSVTPGQQVSLYVGYGGLGGNFSLSYNGSPGGSTGIGSVVAEGGGWGRTGFWNLFNNYSGGTGGGSGGGGGGNGWPGFYAIPGGGGAAGTRTDSQGAGGYCTGNDIIRYDTHTYDCSYWDDNLGYVYKQCTDSVPVYGWSTDIASFITKVSYAPGAGGYSPGGWRYWGGGGGGGLVIDSSAVNGGDGQSSPNNGGKGYGGGGGGCSLDYFGAGGAGAPGAVYIEWDGGSDSCALSCSVTFDENPLVSQSTKVHWSSSNADLFYINNVGYVGASGSAQVSNPGDYSGAVSGAGGSASCTAVLKSSIACVPTASTCSVSGNLIDDCGNTTDCTYGCSADTNRCLACQSFGVCSIDGGRVVNVCDGSTIKDCTAIGQTCVAGQCTEKVPKLSISASSSRVRKGNPTTLSWSAKDLLVGGGTGCSVTSSPPGVFSATMPVNTAPVWSESNQPTGPITSTTVFTLSCNYGTNTIVSTTVVGTVPLIQEI